jgi:hypothetical protein
VIGGRRRRPDKDGVYKMVGFRERTVEKTAVRFGRSAPPTCHRSAWVHHHSSDLSYRGAFDFPQQRESSSASSEYSAIIPNMSINIHAARCLANPLARIDRPQTVASRRQGSVHGDICAPIGRITAESAPTSQEGFLLWQQLN